MTSEKPVQPSVHVTPYVRVYRNVRVPLIPTSVRPEALLGYVPALSVLVGPQHTPQVPFVSPILTPSHGNAPQVPSASQHTNGTAPIAPVVSQNAPKITIVPENINTISSLVDNIPQVSIVPDISYTSAPQVPFISQNAQVPLAPENFYTITQQAPVVSQNVPLSEYHYENFAKVPIVTQNFQDPVEPVNVLSGVPQEQFISQNIASVPVGAPISPPQVPLQAEPVPVILRNSADSIPQTDSAAPSMPVNPQNEVPAVGIMSQNIPRKPVVVAKNTNSQHPTRISQASSESSEKTHIPSQCQNIINEKLGANYPIVTFKHILNPPQNIQEYYNSASDELNKVRSFRCHRQNKIGYVSSEWVAYDCHSEEVPVNLLVQVPKAVQSGQIIDVELDAPYSAMVINAVDGNYDGVQRTSYLEDLLTPCSYGMAVLKPEGVSTRVVFLPVSVPNGKFILREIEI